MGQMTNEQLVTELQKDNPKRSAVEVQIYADALQAYHEASINIRKNGTIVFHPRTGAPIENPYLKVQTSKGAVLAKMANIKADRVMRLLSEP